MTFRIQIAHTDQSFDVESGETILAAALRANVNLEHDCQLGGCGTCRIKLIEGSVAYDEFPLALTPEEEDQGYALACQAKPECNLVISSAFAQAEMPTAAHHLATVHAIRPVSPLVTRLVLEVPAVTELDYRPGQHMNVILPDNSTRSFSMASAPQDNRIDFHVRHIEGGRFTQDILGNLKVGEALHVELPLGGFYFRADDDRPLLMVATGTGLAPIKAILESLMCDPSCPPVCLYWGARTAADLYLHDEILTWSDRLYEFKFMPVLSRAAPTWRGRRGYVQDAVAADFEDLSEHAIYLCGSPEMIFSAKQAFAARGASIEHIYTEGFTLQHSLPVPS
ncbi:2Fe-2S iron-sulfur cluster-binding protein [Bradyrhizobium canariense]|uniref:CDP-4-dehydro-6-deoxyglucose reductase n=1 Tax=Bradyrhizobium canariense TaxID=255045 RepID=A0A1H2AL62_9BRAD|nr:2Fe-2S iron-sulfur cluster-binding protein [Bradyrhizobium canariense]SDT46587.1 CDP-4-dehydro-6-deoxyglucose reductase [Bradyrhizobium canariense]